MERITAKTNRKLATWFLISGTVFSLIAIALYFYEESSKTSMWFQLVLGPLWIGQGIYQLKYEKTILSWNDDCLELKLPGRKKRIYEKEDIKNLTLTQKHFIVNAGMGDGEMIDLKYFSESDKQRLQDRFGDYNITPHLA